MKLINFPLIAAATAIMLFIASCSCDNENVKTVKIFPEVEQVAKQHAQQFANASLSKMEIQNKLFEVRAHEQSLREAGMNEEADYYINMFMQHLAVSNPSLATEIKKQP